MHITEAAKGLSEAQRAFGKGDTLDMPMAPPPAARRSGGYSCSGGLARATSCTARPPATWWLAEFRAYLPERYNDIGRESEDFAAAADTLLTQTSARDRIDKLPANLACMAIFKNPFGAQWVNMPREGEHVGEIFRRVGPREEQFAHVFSVAWRRALPSVAVVLPNSTAGGLIFITQSGGAQSDFKCTHEEIRACCCC